MDESKEQQWRVVPMKIHGWAIHDAAGNVVVKDIYEEEIACFIVRAVNSHAALVEALREILAGPARAVPSGKFWVWDRAHAALDLAEKES